MILEVTALLAAVAAISRAAVIVPYAQPLTGARNQLGYLVPSQSAPDLGYQQAYYYSPADFVRNTPEIVGVNAQQQTIQQPTPLIFKSGEALGAKPDEGFSGRLVLDNPNAFLNSALFPSSEIDAALKQLISLRQDGVVARADLYRSGDTTIPPAPVGWALFYQKSATSNVEMYVNVLSVGATITGITATASLWTPVQIRSGSALGTAGALCDPAVLGTDFVTSGLALPSIAPRTGTDAAGSTVNTITGSASYTTSNTINLSGTTPLINKIVRIAPNTFSATDTAESYCGVIRILQ